MNGHMEWGRAAPITGLATRGTREPKGSTNPTTVLFLRTQPEDPEQGSCQGGRSNSWPGTQDRSAESPQILRASLPSLILSLVSPFHSLILPAPFLSWKLGWALEIVTNQNPGPILRVQHLTGGKNLENLQSPCGLIVPMRQAFSPACFEP